jgi:hypothetical protein
MPVSQLLAKQSPLSLKSSQIAPHFVKFHFDDVVEAATLYPFRSGDILEWKIVSSSLFRHGYIRKLLMQYCCPIHSFPWAVAFMGTFSSTLHHPISIISFVFTNFSTEDSYIGILLDEQSLVHYIPPSVVADFTLCQGSFKFPWFVFVASSTAVVDACSWTT